MQVNTKYFGSVKCGPEDVLCFPQGLFGFEEEKQFLLLPFSGSKGTLLCFQSVKTPQLAFVAMNPFALKPDYTPIISDEALKMMGVTNSKELCYYVFCVVKDPIEESTVNLRCPIVVNEETEMAAQIILETTEYGMRQPLSEFNMKEDTALC